MKILSREKGLSLPPPSRKSKLMKSRMSLLCLLTLCLSACSTGTLEVPQETPSATPTLSHLASTSTATALPTPSATSSPESNGDGVVTGWAVLAEKDDYSDVDMVDLRVDYINLKRMRQVLLDKGWKQNQILELIEFDQTSLREALKWLSEQADGDDLVIVFISSHGMYLQQNIHLEDFILMDWIKIKSAERVFILEACRAGAFTPALKYDPQPYLAIGSVGKDEGGWSGLEEEGLPIIGGVFTYYFTAAFTDPEADSDSDGAVSLQEAAVYAEDHQRTYMHEVVYEVPEFLEMSVDAGFPVEDPDFPHVVMDDTIGSPVILSTIVH